MKRKILVMIAAIAAVLILPLAANAASVDDLTFDAATGTITDCNAEAEGELIIPEEIDGVKVTSIGNAAFKDCIGLTSVKIPDSVTTIADYAFEGCSGLTSVNIPDSGVSINRFAFEDCSGLTSISIPSSVRNIGSGAFASCGRLNINVSSNNTEYCDINGVLFDKNKTLIMAYAKDKIQPEYVIPNGVTGITSYAFGGCAGLTSINIPKSVKYTWGSAFNGCTGLTNINIPDSFTVMYDYANDFIGCGSLNISVGQNNTSLCDIDGVLFSKDKKTLLAYAKDKIQPKYIIPEGTTKIGTSAFEKCTGLTSINIPGSVTCIELDAFRDCTGLTNIHFPDSVTEINQSAFEGCSNLTSVTMGSGVTKISDYTFRDCDNLTSITIPNSVTSIGWCAFENCSSLSDVYYNGSKKEWDMVYIDAENDCLKNATIHFAAAPLEVVPVEPVVDEEANTVEVPVTVVEPERAEELKDVRLYAAEYDADGHLLNVTVWKNEEINGDTVTITADIPNAAKYKLMLWDGNNVPLMDAVEDITEIQ